MQAAGRLTALNLRHSGDYLAAHVSRRVFLLHAKST